MSINEFLAEFSLMNRGRKIGDYLLLNEVFSSTLILISNKLGQMKGLPPSSNNATLSQ